MCGVAALVCPRPAPERERLVAGMGDLLRHRGPDDSGGYGDERTGLSLGHRRLSIIDLSEGGHQPMRRGPLIACYNGEVYNYLELRAELAARGETFRTDSDTEVLLAAFSVWGEEALARLNGMFAILLYDEERRRLYLCRDRFGVKPLYYLHDGPVFIAASEPKAILHAARRLDVPVGVDQDILACFLADAAIEDDERTFFSSIRRVLPGEIVALDLAPGLRLQRRRWYELTPQVCGASSGPSADEHFRSLFTDAVRLRLRSDVRVGTCLSGGLDSSSIVCVAARRLEARPVTYSAVYGAGEPTDESRHIAQVVEHAGVDNRQVNPESRFSPEALLRFVALHDEPVGGTSVWAQHCVFRLARDDGAIVMLDGQGADETLTGYHGAFRPLWTELLMDLQLGRLGREVRAAHRLHGYRPLPSLLRAGVLFARHRLLPQALYRRHLLRKWRGFFAPGKNPCFRLHVPPAPPDPPHLDAWAGRSLLHAYLYGLVVGASLQTILRYEDRNSMAASIEARAPFLDYRLVQHCLSRPAAELVEDGYTKALLRRSLRGILPESIRLRADKIGFATPEARWLAGPLRPLFLDLLGSRSMRQRGVFNLPALESAYLRFLAGPSSGPSGGPWSSATDTYAFWKALNVELWLQSMTHDMNHTGNR